MAGINPIELQKALKGAHYPATREKLADLARDNGADDKVVKKLRSLPHERFEGPDQVSKDVSGR
jgi:hypothetical protein